MITAAVHNTGGRAIDLSGTIELTDGPGGLSAGPFALTLGITIAVGDTETATTTMENSVPAGPWTATITLRSGLLEISEQATITFPARGKPPPHRRHRSHHCQQATRTRVGPMRRSLRSRCCWWPALCSSL